MMFYNNKAMSLMELMEDNVFSKIQVPDIAYYIDKAMEIGFSEVDYLTNNNFSIDDIISSKGIKVNIIEKEYRLGDIKFRAEIIPKKKEINIIKLSIEEMYKTSLREKFTLDEIIDIHKAHELFHLIEFCEDKYVYKKLPKIKTFKLLKLENLCNVLKTSEIAAHSFCRKLLNLQFHPKNLDYHYLVFKGEISEKKLNEHISEKCKKYLNLESIYED
ncbi:MAG: hypothetical protein GY756_04170 [bacterium]|nr:hypothetical protein [bacterium]